MQNNQAVDAWKTQPWGFWCKGEGDYGRCIRDTARKVEDDPLLQKIRPPVALLSDEAQVEGTSDERLDGARSMREFIDSTGVGYTLHACIISPTQYVWSLDSQSYLLQSQERE